MANTKTACLVEEMKTTSENAPQLSSDVGEYYDRRYSDTYLIDTDDLEWRRIQSILESIPANLEQVLDYGCGNGRWAPYLADFFRQARIFGTDPSGVAVEQARQRFSDGVFEPMKNDRAPFGDQRFDLVFSYHVLEHVVSLEDTIRDMVELTKPNGWILTIFPCGNRGSFEQRIARKIRDGVERKPGRDRCFFFEDSSHLRRLASDNTVSLFERNGVEVVGEYFANQFFGALEWISKDNPEFAGLIFDEHRVANERSRIALRFWRKLFRWIHTAKKKKGLKSKAISKCIDSAAWAEWKLLRRFSAGSAQYLLFRKPPRD